MAQSPAQLLESLLSDDELDRIEQQIQDDIHSRPTRISVPIVFAITTLVMTVTVILFLRRRKQILATEARFTRSNVTHRSLTPSRSASPLFSSGGNSSPDGGPATPPPRLQERRFLLSRALRQRAVNASHRGNRTAFHIPIFRQSPPPTRPLRPISSSPLDLEIGWAVSRAADSVAREPVNPQTFTLGGLSSLGPYSHGAMDAFVDEPSLEYEMSRFGLPRVAAEDIGVAREYPAPKSSDDIPLIDTRHFLEVLDDSFSRIRSPSPAQLHHRRGRIMTDDDIELLGQRCGEYRR